MTNQESHYKILQVKASADKTAIVDAIAILRIKQRDNAAALARCEASFLVLNDEIARDSYDKQLKEDVVNEDIRSENMTRNAFILLSLFNWFLPKQGLINAFTKPRYQGPLECWLLFGLVAFGIFHIAFIFQILFHGFVSLANTLRYMPRNYLIATIYATVVIVAWLGLFSVATRLDEPELHNESTPAAWEWYVTQLPFATIFMDSTQTAPFNEKTIGFLFLALTKKTRVFWSAYTALGSAFALLHSSLRSKFKNSANSALVPESKLELAGLEMFTEADPQQYNFCFITELQKYSIYFLAVVFFFGYKMYAAHRKLDIASRLMCGSADAIVAGITAVVGLDTCAVGDAARLAYRSALTTATTNLVKASAAAATLSYIIIYNRSKK